MEKFTIEDYRKALHQLGEAHTLLARTKLLPEEYNPISGLLAEAKITLFKFQNPIQDAADFNLPGEEEKGSKYNALLFAINNLADNFRSPHGLEESVYQKAIYDAIDVLKDFGIK
jgi:hypothetical protein